MSPFNRKSTCWRITEAMKTTPTALLKVFWNLTPSEIGPVQNGKFTKLHAIGRKRNFQICGRTNIKHLLRSHDTTVIATACSAETSSILWSPRSNMGWNLLSWEKCSFHLPSRSVFRAELYAILQCAGNIETTPTESIIMELLERQRREANIMVANVREAQVTTPLQRKEEDANVVKEILKKVSINVNLDNITC
nr:uncharacterized protein LOC111503754 [Leptinotarsa decemlineata]